MDRPGAPFETPWRAHTCTICHDKVPRTWGKSSAKFQTRQLEIRGSGFQPRQFRARPSRHHRILEPSYTPWHFVLGLDVGRCRLDEQTFRPQKHCPDEDPACSDCQAPGRKGLNLLTRLYPPVRATKLTFFPEKVKILRGWPGNF